MGRKWVAFVPGYPLSPSAGPLMALHTFYSDAITHSSPFWEILLLGPHIRHQHIHPDFSFL